MKNKIKDVHTSHCCCIHGCKYGKDEECTVIQYPETQEYPCEVCDFDGITNMKTLKRVLDKNIKRCNNCGHILED